MGYHKRYEDSYLDEEDEEFAGDDRTDGEKLIALIQKPSRTPKEEERIKKLTERLCVGAKLPGPPGEQAILGLGLVADAYAAVPLPDVAIALWLRISEIATAIGNKNLYYRAMDKITALSSDDDAAV